MFVKKMASRISQLVPVTLWDILFYFLICIISFFTFQHGDINHTGGSSLAYLNGHIQDFYEENKKLFVVNNYLPSTYIIFSLWNIPIKALHLAKNPSMDMGAIVFWYKLLPVLFYAATSIVIYKIGLVIGLNKINSKLMAIFWLTTPIAFFSQFIFGQYDIFTVFFMLLGILYYLKKNIKGFILFFAISLTFKYFPLFVFVPLLLLVEKRPLKLMGKMILFMIPIGLEILFYMHSPSFKTGVFGFSANQRIFSTGFSLDTNTTISIFVVLWFIICAACYWRDIDQDKDLYKWSLYVSLTVSSLIFGLIFWHPQWLLFTTPFLAITSFLHKKSKFFILMDILMMYFFVAYTINAFPSNVDETLLNLGIFHYLGVDLQNPTIRMRDIFPIHDTSIYYSLITSCFLINIIFKFPYNQTSFFNDNINDDLTIKTNWNMVRVRFFLGVSIFIIPAFVTLVFPHYGKEIYNVSTSSKPIPGTPIISGVVYGQVFKAKSEIINEIKVQLATFARTNSSNLTFTLQEFNQNGSGNIVFTKEINAADILDNQYFPIPMYGTQVKANEFYIFTLKSNDATVENSVTVWHTSSNVNETESFATLNGAKQNYDIHFIILGK